MELTKEEIQKRIEGLKQQHEQLVSNVHMCVGAIKALEALLEQEKKNENQ